MPAGREQPARLSALVGKAVFYEEEQEDAAAAESRAAKRAPPDELAGLTSVWITFFKCEKRRGTL